MTPDAAVPPTIQDIREATARLHGVATVTPLEPSPWLTEIAKVPVYLKLECWQRTRSFKLRGGYNAIALLRDEERARGIVTASAGNHGQAVALAASTLGARATVFLPHDAPAVKKMRIQSYGARVVDTFASYDDAEAAAVRHAEETGEYFVHAFSDRAVVAGQGTVGMEIASALPDVRQVIVPVGGGGLAIGVATALNALAPDAVVTGVQSSETRAMYDAFQAGRIVDSPITPTLADGLAGCTDATAYAWLRDLIDGITLVPDSSLASAIRKLYETTGVVAEGAGIVGVAALMQSLVHVDGPTVVVISGGNIDGERLARILTT